jgi:hypothetical protein
MDCQTQFFGEHRNHDIYHDIFLNCNWVAIGGSGTVHIYTQTIHSTTQNKQYIEQYKNKQYIEQHKNIGSLVRAVPIFACFTLAFALQLRKKHGKPSVRVAEECQLAR